MSDTTKDVEVVPEAIVEGTSAALTTAEVSDDDKQQMLKAAGQIEFYFADSNLPYDKFMWTLHTKDPEHWVPIQTVSSFKRMREYAAKGVKWVAEALRLSEHLEVDETGTKVRRRTEVKEPKGILERSVYAKGFPEEDATLQTKLEEFFAKYGKTNAVRMRRDEAKKFKGSVFAEFTDFDTVDNFLNADPKPSWDGKELLIMTKEAYCEMKIKEKGLTGKAAIQRKEGMNKRGFNAFASSSSSKPSSSAADKKGAATTVPKDILLDFMGTKIPVHEDEEGNGTVKAEDVPFVKGATLKFDGCGGDVTWSEIKDPIKEKFDGRAPYIKYSRGSNEGLVGFHKALTEADLATVKEAIKTINKKEVTWSFVDEEEEKQFQVERAQVAARTALGGGHDSSRGRGGRGGGRGRGGRGGGRGGGGRGGGGKRGGGRDRGSGGDRNAEKAQAKPSSGGGGDEQTGEKRKRAVEPDGGPDVGVRGKVAPPTIATASSAKKVKVDSGAAAPAVAAGVS